jgi:hypothetical protein
VFAVEQRDAVRARIPSLGERDDATPSPVGAETRVVGWRWIDLRRCSVDQAAGTPRANVRWAGVVNVIVAIWLIAAPLALGYADVTSALVNDYIVGSVVLGVAAVRIARPSWHPLFSLVNLVLGVWLLVAPFALHHEGLSAEWWSDIVAGIIVAIESSISLAYGRRAARGAR